MLKIGLGRSELNGRNVPGGGVCKVHTACESPAALTTRGRSAILGKMSLISNLLSPKRLSGLGPACLAAISGLAAVVVLGLSAPSHAAGQAAPFLLAQASDASPSDTAAAAAPDSSQPVEEWHERVMPVLPERPRVPMYDPGTPIFRKVLKNGVVLMVQEQRTSGDVAAMVALRMGTMYEDDQTSGLSQVLMRALTAGTKKLPPAELQLRVLAHKVTLESGASADYGQVGLQTMREDAPDAIDLLAQIVLSPSFPDTAVENSRSYFLAKAAQDVEDPLFATYTSFLGAMYQGSPFARPPHGAVQALSEARRADVLALYKKFFVGGNLAVSVVGNVDAKKTMAQLEKLFASAPAGAPPAPTGGAPRALPSDTLITSERPILARSLVYGFPAPGYADRDYAAFMVIDSYLRSADRSPITFWMPQRDQAAGVGVMYPSYPHRSSVAVYLAAKPENYSAARDTVASVFEQVKTTPFDKGEWGVQVKRVQNGFFWKQNEPVIRARNLSRWEVQGVTTEFPHQFETALLQLKPEDVRDAAARWFTHSAEVSLKPSGRDGQP